MNSLLLRRASVAPGVLRDLRIDNGVIAGTPGSRHAAVFELDGRPVLPGLADHHIHLFSLAASLRSVDCHPSMLVANGGLVSVLRSARESSVERWLRGTGYDLTTSGWIDRVDLDRANVGPLRLQDRSGMYWILDSIGLIEVLPSDPADWPDGVERDGSGAPTGRLVRLDAWLRERVPANTGAPDLAGVGRWLASRGVTAVTDATYTNAEESLAALSSAALPQRVRAMTAVPDVRPSPGVALDAVKIVFDDQNLPELDRLTAAVQLAHRRRRTVAMHCVSAGQVVLALAAGIGPGDRLEHVTSVPAALLPSLSDSGVAICVQPDWVRTRGDRHLAESDPADIPDLHRLASLRKAGIPIIGGSDAPFGDADPWAAVATAARRRTIDGVELAAGEAISPRDALSFFQTRPVAPWIARTVQPGDPADLVVLDSDWTRLGDRPRIFMTLIDGRIAYPSRDRRGRS